MFLTLDFGGLEATEQATQIGSRTESGAQQRSSHFYTAGSNFIREKNLFFNFYEKNFDRTMRILGFGIMMTTVLWKVAISCSADILESSRFLIWMELQTFFKS